MSPGEQPSAAAPSPFPSDCDALERLAEFS
jgi:hypothetical protein